MVFSRMKLHSLSSLPSIQLPSPKDVHLWYVKPSEVKSEPLLKRYFDILSPCERENVLRMRGEDLKKSALLARALVRTTISRYHMDPKITPKSLKFRKNEHGKPEVEWLSSEDSRQTPLKFNLSHTSSLIACGVTANSRIGIDVEEKKRTIRHNVLSFARRYFSEHEVQYLSGISDQEEQRMKFIKLWTLKEAYVKALGKGFSGAPFKTFTIHSNDASEVIVDSDESTDLTRDWKFSLLELANSHYAAICTEKHDVSTKVNLTVWKTIPFLEDERVCGTDEVKMISV